MAKTFEDLERNDKDAALAFAKAAMKAGTYTPELGEALLMLQDDQDELLDALADAVDAHKKKNK